MINQEGIHGLRASASKTTTENAKLHLRGCCRGNDGVQEITIWNVGKPNYPE